MNKFQENKLGMYYTIQNLIESFKKVWDSNIPFKKASLRFLALILLIVKNRDIQMSNITGVSVDKRGNRENMCSICQKVVVILRSYAASTGNNELLKSVHYTATKMSKSRDTTIVGICNNVLAKAVENLPNLSEYNITQETLDGLKNSIDIYVAAISKPDIAKVQTKNATKALGLYFKEADDILNKLLDLDIEMFRDSDPSFYLQYKTARKVVGTPATVMSVIGKLVLKGNHEVVGGATLTISLISNGHPLDAAIINGKKIVRKSTAKGNVRIKNLQEGTYEVMVHKIGYKDVTMMFHVANGETTSLIIEMEKA
jgi:hypothetical protein